MNYYYPLQLLKPSQNQIDECTARTAAALGLIPDKNAKKAATAVTAKEAKPTFFQYRTQDNVTRTIQVHQAQYDPLAPTAFRLKNLNQRPPSPPPVSYVDPVLTKLTQAEKDEWKIPTAVSNWTNKQAFTVDLAARAMMDKTFATTVNVSEKHTQMNQTLDQTLQRLRQEVTARKQLQQEQRQLKELQTKNSLLNAGKAVAQGIYKSDQQQQDPTRGDLKQEHDELQPTMGLQQNEDGNNDDDSLEAIRNRTRRQQEREQIQRQQSRPQREIVHVNQSSRPRNNNNNNNGNNTINSTNAYDNSSSAFPNADDRLTDLAAQSGVNRNLEDDNLYETELFDNTKPKHFHVADISAYTGRGANNPVQFVLTGSTNNNNNTNNNNQQQQQPPPDDDDDNNMTSRQRNRNYQ